MANGPTISKGSTGAAVKKAQTALIDRKYLNKGDDDGDFGVKTEAAVKSYQTDRSAGKPLALSFPLVIDGIVGPKTWFRLTPPEIKRGAKGDAVKLLQELLKHAGHNPGPIDGDFGPLTEAAVRAFQAANVDFDGKQLKVDGIVGRRTWAALKS